MKRSRSSAGAWRWTAVLPVLLGSACGGPQSLGDTGAKCFRDDDCAPGLICVAPPAEPKSRVCSDDPTPLISNVDGPPIAVGGDAAMAGSAGAAVTGGGGAAGTVGAAGGGAGGTMPAAGASGTATAGTDTGGTDAGGTDAGGADAGGTDAGGTDAGGGSSGSNAGTDPGGSGGSVAGTSGAASDGGAQ